MFGYVKINKPELKVREYETYQGYYCGLCQTLKQSHGLRGRLTLTYDMTFLTILLSGLYEPKTTQSKKGCVVHPMGKHLLIQNEISTYAADMNVLLSYLKLLDDWKDDKNYKSRAGACVLKKAVRKVKNSYPEKTRNMLSAMKHLSECEQRKETFPDVVAGCFGDVVAELFVYRKDHWEQGLRNMGYFLGKYIYLLDAYMDVEKDAKTGSYNVFLTDWSRERGYDVLDEQGEPTQEFLKDGQQILKLMMAECAREFEKLPIVENAELLRNILYAGVWQAMVSTKK